MPYTKNVLTLLCLALLHYAAAAQSTSTAIKMADSLYRLRQFKKASREYFEAFAADTSAESGANLFTAAKACAQGAYPDSAFKYLRILAGRRQPQWFDPILYETAFYKLHADKRWDTLTAIIEKQRRIFKPSVALELTEMQQQRQAAERKKYLMAYQHGAHSAVYQQLRDSVRDLDTINYHKLRSIINTYSWPGPNVIGAEGVQALLYLFQKLSLPTQKHYFALISTAFKTGGLDAQNFAPIADRIALYDTGYQIYGTLPNPNTILNRDSVNVHRVEIGLKLLQ